LGFAGSAVPAVIDHFKDKEKNKQEIEVLKLQGELVKQGSELDLLAFREKAADSEHARLIEHDMSMSNESGFFGGLRKSVRPVITYLFFTLFATVKGTMLYYSYTTTGDFLVAVQQIWDEETQAIFAAIISFWFGSRALEKRKL